jgi:hypothetical protein
MEITMATGEEPTIATPQFADGTIPPRRFDPILQGDTIEAETLSNHIASQKRTAKQSWTDNINNSVAAKMIRNIGQRVDPEEDIFTQIGQGIVAATGQAGKWGTPDWDKSKEIDKLTADMPREYWDDIMAQDTLIGAQITRKNIEDELRRYQRMGLDKGSVAAMGFLGSFLDIDAPLVLASGGLIGAAKVSGKAAYAARRLGLRSSTALRVGGATAGLSGGAQVGALLGAGEALNSDVSTWVDGVAVALTSAVMGAGIGAIAPEAMLPLKSLRENTIKGIAAGDEFYHADSMVKLTDEVPASRVMPQVGNTDAPATSQVGEPTAAGEVLDDGAEVPAYFGPQGRDLSAAAGPTQSVFPALKDPVRPMSDATKKHIQSARDYLFHTDFDVKIRTALDDAWVRLSTSRIFQIGTGDVTQLWKSKSSVANRLAATIFEIPGGQVRGEVANAAMLTDMYTKRVMRHVQDVPKIMHEWAGKNGKHLFIVPGTSKRVGVNREGQRIFMREVMLDMNNASMGRPRSQDPHVRTAADQYGAAGKEAVAVMQGRANEIPLEGSQILKLDDHFMPYRANGAKLAKLLQDGTITKKDMVNAYRDSYMSAGTFTDKDLATTVAKAYVDRFLARGTQLDDQMIGLFSQDGREFLQQALRASKVSQKAIDGIMRKFDGDMTERGKLSTLKNRNDLDLDTPLGNTGLKIVDIMDGDFDAVYSRYTRQIAGNSALARHGITSRAMRNEMIEAMQAEQRALGETPIDPQLVEAMLSEFDGGPQIGYDSISGQNKGIGAMADLKSFTSLALLSLNGLTQIAETGLQIVAVGAKNWYGRGPGRMFNAQLKRGNKAALDEVAYLMGNIGQDHHALRLHLNLDEAYEYSVGDSVVKNMAQRGREMLNTANMVQGYTSLMNHVRQYQQEIAALGMMDKVARLIKDGRMDMFEANGRINRDLALTDEHYMKIKDLIDNGTIVFKTEKTLLGDMTYVDRLNLHQWDQTLAQDFAAALNRSVNQQVQRAMAGESSRWMHTTWGSAVTHLQTFPILSVQKQFFRNALSRDGQAVITALAAYGTAYLAMSLRDTVTGAERSDADRAKMAFGYSSMTGWMPLYTDPLMSLLGMEDYRVNTFGPYARPMSVPMVDTFNNIYRAPGAIKDALAGEDDWTDRQALRAIPFFRLLEAAVNVGSFGQVELIQAPKVRPQ